MSNQYCKFLTNGMRLQSEYGRLRAQPCCVHPDMTYLDEDKFDERMKRFHDLDLCLYCDGHGTDSVNVLREFSKQRVTGDIPNGKVAYLELAIDNDCNAACLSCNEIFSSTWIAQNKKFKIKSEHDYPDPQDNQAVIAQIFDKLDLSELQQVRFFGGEPFRSGTTELFLEKLTNSMDVSKIEVYFTTNASLEPNNHMVEMIKKFKFVQVGFSIDGYGEQNDYLRYPLTWKFIEEAIDQFKSIKIDSRFEVNFTVNGLNAYYADRVVDWAQEKFRNTNFDRVNFSVAFGIMNPSTICDELKDAINIKFADDPRFKQLLDVVNQWQYSPENTASFVKYLTKWDQFRKNSWTDTFPEMIPYYQKYI